MHSCDCLVIPEVVVALATMLLPASVWSQPAPQKLNLSADLVLKSDFCAAEMKRGNWFIRKERFPVGEKLCPRLQSEFPSVFRSLDKVEEVPSPNTATTDVILIPKIDDISATDPMSRKQEVVVVLEWTALNREGRTLWTGTVQASAKESQGSAATHGKHLRRLNNAVVSDAVNKSIQAITTAPELVKLAK